MKGSIDRDDIPKWQTYRSFLLGGGSLKFPALQRFLAKYGVTEDDLRTFFRLGRYKDGKWYSDANSGKERATGQINEPQKMIEAMQRLGMIKEKPIEPPIDEIPF